MSRGLPGRRSGAILALAAGLRLYRIGAHGYPTDNRDPLVSGAGEVRRQLRELALIEEAGLR